MFGYDFFNGIGPNMREFLVFYRGQSSLELSVQTEGCARVQADDAFSAQFEFLRLINEQRSTETKLTFKDLTNIVVAIHPTEWSDA